MSLTNTSKRHDLQRGLLVNVNMIITQGHTELDLYIKGTVVRCSLERTIEHGGTYVWAAVTWKMFSWYLRPPKKQLHPSTSKIFDRIEPNIDVWTMRSSSAPRNFRVNQWGYTTRTLEQGSNTDNHFDLASCLSGYSQCRRC